MERSSSENLDAEGFEKERVKFSIAVPSGDSFTSQPERDLKPEDSELGGGAAPEPKKTMAEKVKGLFKGRHSDDDATDSTEATPGATTAAGNEQTGHSIDSTAPGNEESAPHPQGETGAALTDEHGNLKPGPHTDSVKRVTILSKIKDKVHGSK